MALTDQGAFHPASGKVVLEVRILHFVLSLDMGGAHLSAVNIACAMKARGHEVYMLYSSKGSRRDKTHPILLEELTKAGVVVLNIPSMVRGLNPSGDAVTFFSVLRAVKRIRPDVINTHSAKPGLMTGAVTGTLKIPLTVHTLRGFIHERTGSMFASATLLKAERIIAARVDRIVAVSPLLVEKALQKGIGKRYQYSVIRSGIDVGHFRDHRDRAFEARAVLGIPPGVKVVGSVCALVPEKRVLDLAKAFSAIGKIDGRAFFILAGDGPLRDAFLNQVRSLGDRFCFVGIQPDPALTVSAMDCFLLASGAEGLPRVIQEAFCAGVPVVATDTGAVRELVKDGETGFVVSVGDVEAMTDRTIRILQDDRMHRTMSANAELMIGEDYDTARVVDRYLSLYESGLSYGWGSSLAGSI
jgi:glycosyltransferase involved in cell wall biosynthesis